jgi:hypothetical protein
VLGGLAEVERELIMARTGEGRLRANRSTLHIGDAAVRNCSVMQSRARPPRQPRISARDDAVEPMFTMNIEQQLPDMRIRLESATARQPLGCAP